MIACRIVDNTKRVSEAVRKATPGALERMAIDVQKTAQEQFVQSDEPSRPGSPPHTRAGAMPDSILYAVDRENADAVIGTAYSKIGDVGYSHEFGKQRFGQDYDIREFMGPAIEKSKDRLASEWYGIL